MSQIAGSAKLDGPGPTGPTPEPDDDGFTPSPFQRAIQGRALELRLMEVQATEVAERREAALLAYEKLERWYLARQRDYRWFGVIVLLTGTMSIVALAVQHPGLVFVSVCCWLACIGWAIRAMAFTTPPRLKFEPTSAELEPQTAVAIPAPSILDRKVEIV